MSPHVHAEISVKKRGGRIEDYYPIHFFLDSTKELCSDNRHRILHTIWGIRRVVIPIFGATIINSDGKTINVKDLCEQDHILPDYRNRFIPTLDDFVLAFEDLEEEEIERINRVFAQFDGHKEIQSLLMSPLNITGTLKSLRITHNSWFCNELLPNIFSNYGTIRVEEPVEIFKKMKFEMWMDNGSNLPPSARNMDSFV